MVIDYHSNRWTGTTNRKVIDYHSNRWTGTTNRKVIDYHSNRWTGTTINIAIGGLEPLTER